MNERERRVLEVTWALASREFRERMARRFLMDNSPGQLSADICDAIAPQWVDYAQSKGLSHPDLGWIEHAAWATPDPK